MQVGEYIKDRFLPVAIRVACERQGVEFAAYSGDWVLRMEKHGKIAWMCGYTCDYNGAAASHLARDKVGTYEVLHAAGVPAVLHALVRSVPAEPVPTAALHQRFAGGDVVIKPLNGAGGHGVQRYEHLDRALEFVDMSSEPGWAVSPYLDIQLETRLVVLDGEVALAYEKRDPHTKHGVKFYNLSYGAHASTIANESIPDELRALAVAACKQLGLGLTAVDIVTLATGEQLVLEVNSSFSMEHYARQSVEDRQRALELYDKIVASLFVSK